MLWIYFPDLSGHKHQVITGVVLLKGEREIAFADITDVWFHPLTSEQIAFYVDKYQPYDKAWRLCHTGMDWCSRH